jgi:hypothetical protein
MKNVLITGLENNRPSASSFTAWIEEINNEREEDLFGIDKYIMGVELNGGVTSITTFNGSVYTISFNEKSHKDLKDLVGYKVTFYPKVFEGYELEAYYLWGWDDPLREQDFGYLVINKVVEVKKADKDGLIIFENGDYVSVPFKDYEKPYFRASKRMHGDDLFREGYPIDFDERMQVIRDKYIGEYVIYSTRLNTINVGGDLSDIKIYRESPHKEYSEKDKFSFRWESGVIKSHAFWDSYRVPIYLEDGRIMTFSFFDYARHIDGKCTNRIVSQLKDSLKNEVGKPYKFLVIFGGDKDINSKSMDIVSLTRAVDDDFYRSQQ